MINAACSILPSDCTGSHYLSPQNWMISFAVVRSSSLKGPKDDKEEVLESSLKQQNTQAWHKAECH